MGLPLLKLGLPQAHWDDWATLLPFLSKRNSSVGGSLAPEIPSSLPISPANSWTNQCGYSDGWKGDGNGLLLPST